MNINLLLADNPEFKIVKVKFDGSPKFYTYKTMLDIVEGDTIAVDTPSHGFMCLKAVEVIPGMEFDFASNNFGIKWVVSKIDIEQYEQAQEMERGALKKLNAIAHNKARQEMLKNMEEALGEKALGEVRKLVRL
jgi:hypothetical protein